MPWLQSQDTLRLPAIGHSRGCNLAARTYRANERDHPKNGYVYSEAKSVNFFLHFLSYGSSNERQSQTSELFPTRQAESACCFLRIESVKQCLGIMHRCANCKAALLRPICMGNSLGSVGNDIVRHHPL